MNNRMKHRTRYALALTLVATTLCAGRLFASDQNAGIENRPMPEKLVARLTRVFSRTISRSPMIVQQQLAIPILQPVQTGCTDRAYSVLLSPLQLHLPPPLV